MFKLSVPGTYSGLSEATLVLSYTYKVPNYNTLSPPNLFSYLSILSKLDFKFASFSGPVHTDSPHLLPLLHKTVFAHRLLFAVLYNHGLIYLFCIYN